MLSSEKQNASSGRVEVFKAGMKEEEVKMRLTKDEPRGTMSGLGIRQMLN